MWGALFPGQGSQSVGMGKFLYDEFARARETFEEASDAVGVDFKKLCFESSESDLALTENTQPCLVLVSTATERVLRDVVGLKPGIASGHSVGEYAAVVAAGALPFASAIVAVRERGRAMQNAVPIGEGGMTAVMGLETGQIARLCKWVESGSGLGPVEPANINAPGQIVVSGRRSALDWMATNFTVDAVPGAGRVKFIPLKVSAPFHCSMMKPAEDHMAGVLKSMPFSAAAFPVIQNVNAKPTREPDALRANLISQISAPVRWIECMTTLVQMGVKRSVECGSGRVLAGLAKKIVGENLQVFGLNSMADLKSLETALKGS